MAIETLIVQRCRSLGLCRAGLVRRTRYKNLAKALRRLDELIAGVLAEDLIRALPTALDVPPEAVHCAVEATQRQIAEIEETARQASEAAWRAAFKPHALTERSAREPIFVAALIGVDRLLRIDFDLSQSPVTYSAQAIVGVPSRLAESKSESGKVSEALPAFGRPVGVIVNYA